MNTLAGIVISNTSPTGFNAIHWNLNPKPGTSSALAPFDTPT
ncbi:MAG: hypothetical protein WEF53_12145 [Bacteroidota bacterium]